MNPRDNIQGAIVKIIGLIVYSRNVFCPSIRKLVHRFIHRILIFRIIRGRIGVLIGWHRRWRNLNIKVSAFHGVIVCTIPIHRSIVLTPSLAEGHCRHRRIWINRYIRGLNS